MSKYLMALVLCLVTTAVEASKTEQVDFVLSDVTDRLEFLTQPTSFDSVPADYPLDTIAVSFRPAGISRDVVVNLITFVINTEVQSCRRMSGFEVEASQPSRETRLFFIREKGPCSSPAAYLVVFDETVGAFRRIWHRDIPGFPTKTEVEYLGSFEGVGTSLISFVNIREDRQILAVNMKGEELALVEVLGVERLSTDGGTVVLASGLKIDSSFENVRCPEDVNDEAMREKEAPITMCHRGHVYPVVFSADGVTTYSSTPVLFGSQIGGYMAPLSGHGLEIHLQHMEEVRQLMTGPAR